MTTIDPSALPAVALAQAFGGTPPGPQPGPNVPQDSPAQNAMPTDPQQPMTNTRMPLPVVPHDVKPHLGQGAEYDRISAKLRQFPQEHPAVISAVDALNTAEFYNSRRARGVSHEWPAAHQEVLRSLEQVAAAFPGASAPPVPVAPQASVDGTAALVWDATSKHVADQQAALATKAVAAARGSYRIELQNGKAVIFRNGVRIQTQGEVEISGVPQPQGEAPSLLWFGHPNYLEALRFVFRGRYAAASEAGIPLHHVLAYTTKGRMVDTRLKADDLPRMEDEQKHVLAMLEFLVRQDFLEMNEVGGVQMLRLSRTATEAIRYYPYPEAPAVVEEAPRLDLGSKEPAAKAEAITTAEPQDSATISS